MFSFLFVVSLGTFALANPLVSKRWDDFEVKHAWQDVPDGWRYHSPAPSDHVMDMRIALKQDKFEDLVAALYDVSDPYHEK